MVDTMLPLNYTALYFLRSASLLDLKMYFISMH